ncbi:hypothetical protein ACTWP5_13170 [Streptomyces sp. 4N509B]|uniref:hypothetical protein n=1 Tax=Streptomyces sp. 4N509B TaxID=3457413 RepID=UPI003FD42822
MSDAAPDGHEKEPLTALCERLHDDVAAAVHPDEVAALLEAEGLNDARVRDRYGFPDAFALAEELYLRVPRRHHPAPPPDADTGLAPDPLRCALRGLLFALPALAYVIGGPLLSSPEGAGDGGLPAGAPVLLVSALTSWAWNQGLSHRAYVWLGLGDRDAAVRALALGGAAGAAASATAASATATFGEHVSGAVWLFALGQACYLAGATALLVLGQEFPLLLALSPLVAGGVAHLAFALPTLLRATLLLASLTAVAALAARHLARERGESRPAAAASPPLAASVPYGLLGLGTGLLVTLAILAEVIGDGERGAAATSTALGLTLSMGPAEWLLARFRVRARQRLRRHTSIGAFRTAVALELGLGLVTYLAALAVLALACAALWSQGPAPHGARFVVLLLLGAVLWAVLLLQSFGRPLPAATVCGAAAVVQLPGLLPTASVVVAQLVVCAVAAAVLPTAAWLHLSRVTAHR